MGLLDGHQTAPSTNREKCALLKDGVEVAFQDAKGVRRKQRLKVFDESSGELIKILARNHQYLGVNNAIQAVKERKQRDGKLGVFWHTQGPGKSYSMVFFTQKVHRRIGGNFTFLICADRDDLDTQIYKTYAGWGLADDESTRRVFGEYVSTYDFQRAVQDNATLPLYYDARGEKLGLAKDQQTIEQTFQQLLDLVHDLDEDEARIMKSGLDEETNAIFVHLMTAYPRLPSPGYAAAS